MSKIKITNVYSKPELILIFCYLLFKCLFLFSSNAFLKKLNEINAKMGLITGQNGLHRNYVCMLFSAITRQENNNIKK